MKTILRGSILIVLVFLISACATAPSSSGQPLAQQLLVDKARIVMDTFAVDPNMADFRGYLKYAKGVLIIPSLYKAAWFVGGSGGRAVLLVRKPGTDQWVGPAFYTLGSVSFGLQFGGQKAAAILLVMTQKGVDILNNTSVKLGADASVAVGPIGIGAQGATAPALHADYILFARTVGAYIGISLDGAVIDENYDWNRGYYGKPVRPVEIIEPGGPTNPQADHLRAAVARAVRGGE